MIKYEKSSVRTMEDFSRFVGMSRPTVSKYFNDPGTVRESTRQRIEKAIEDVNFRPNMLAVNFNKRRTNFIGIVIPDAADPFYASLVQNVIRSAREKGLITVMLTTDGDLDQEEAVISTLTSLKVAGLLIIPSSDQRSADDYQGFADGTPIVFVDSKVEGAEHFVGTDNRNSISRIVEFLIRTGSAPCFFPMPPVNANARLREDAYVSEMVVRGMTPMIVQCDLTQTWDFEAYSFKATQRILAGGGFPSTTVLCANDRLAYGTMAACHLFGMEIGNTENCDLRIAGHDDHPLAKYSFPTLTTVGQDVRHIASKATQLLVDLIEGNEVSETVDLLYEAQIEMRGSA